MTYQRPASRTTSPPWLRWSSTRSLGSPVPAGKTEVGRGTPRFAESSSIGRRGSSDAIHWMHRRRRARSGRYAHGLRSVTRFPIFDLSLTFFALRGPLLGDLGRATVSAFNDDPGAIRDGRIV